MGTPAPKRISPLIMLLLVLFTLSILVLQGIAKVVFILRMKIESICVKLVQTPKLESENE